MNEHARSDPNNCSIKLDGDSDSQPDLEECSPSDSQLEADDSLGDSSSDSGADNDATGPDESSASAAD